MNDIIKIRLFVVDDGNVSRYANCGLPPNSWTRSILKLKALPLFGLAFLEFAKIATYLRFQRLDKPVIYEIFIITYTGHSN